MARIYLDQPQTRVTKQVPKKRIYLDQPVAPKKRVYLDEKPKNQPQSGGFWRGLGNQLGKPGAALANLTEDTVKSAMYPINQKIYGNQGTFDEYKKSQGIDFTKHQVDVWSGKNKRHFTDIGKDAAELPGIVQNVPLATTLRATTMGGDFLLDPLNKVKIAALTAKGNKALKTGEVALSAGEQAKKGQRALLQFGNMNILPSVGNRVLAASTKANDALRATKYGAKAADMLSGVSTSIRPSGVSRGDFKVLREATTAGKNVQNYTKDKAIQFAVGLEKSLREKGAKPEVRSAILHAIEKGDKSLAPQGLDDVFEAGVKFKGENEAAWKALGGSTLDNYGLAHVATDEVADAASKKNLGSFFSGGKLFSSDTPQDIHRQWVRITEDVSKPIKIGDTIKAPDKGNYGKVVAINGDTMSVRFVNKGTKLSATVDFPVSEVQSARQGSRIANLADEGIQYGNVEKSKYTLDNILESVNKELSNIGKKPILGSTKNFTIDDIVESARKELSGTRSNSADIPLNRKQIDYKMSTNREAPIGKTTLKNVFHKGKKVINVEQATAKEINQHFLGQGLEPIFKEDLPTVVARMGISTGRKQAGVEFLEATKGLEGKAKEIANQTYEKMTNVESIRDAIKAFDKVQNLWKAQVLVAPSYHIRNEVGNLWNNFLANVGPDSYVKSAALQTRMARGTLSKADEALVETMKKEGVIGTGQYGGDITQTIADEIGGASWNPVSQRFGLYKGNRAIGSAIEDNAKIAHYLQKIGDGFNPKAAAESVKKYLFDYSDLTWGEQNILKRVMPFYTWTRKNVPLQVEQFFNQPGKFSNVGTAQRNIESGVETPDERYLNDYIKSNTPMRWSTNEDGSTSYLLLGSWLPAASAVQMLSQNPKKLLEMLSPVYKVPSDMLHNRSFFKDTLGEDQPIERFPNEMKSFLGMDMGAKTANILRNIRVLSELDKLNPGLIFGGKDTPSIIPGGSQNRGAKQSPDAPEAVRWRDFLVGKTQTYDQENSKTFYDRDTENRMGEYTQALDQALKYKNDEQAKKIIQDMEQFQVERQGGANKVLDQFNLMGDQYLEDRFKNKQAEYTRKGARDQMKELIKEGVRTQNPELLKQAAQLDPTYLKDAIKAVTQELATEKLPDEVKRKLYQVEQKKTEQRMLPFYTK